MAMLGIRDARILVGRPGAGRAVVDGDLAIEDGRIVAVGSKAAARADRVLAADGGFCLPGFVQTHVHLCQTLMRGLADDLSLLDWLARRIWPLEAAHSPESVRASARLGIAELLLGGTTSILAMETVRHTQQAFEAVDALGIRAVVGKTHMDRPDTFDGLREDTEDSIREAERLCREWHGRAGGRIRYAYSPRFAVSCTRELLERTAALARRDGVLFHTHASENLDEVDRVRSETGLGNIEYLDSLGCLGGRTVLAHCVHLDDGEVETLARGGVHVAHCPTCNLKLGSGIADVPRLASAGVNVTLGADGAPCNNALDMFEEMKLAAILHNVRHGPSALPATRILEMATGGGARALHLDQEVGVLEVGRRADAIVVDPRGPRAWPREQADPASLLVYAGRSRDVRHVVVDGRDVVRDGVLTTGDLGSILAEADREARELRQRAGLGG
jgi:cytosine/adenosine deaminase-related metal-dependent hydrolase